MLRIDPDSIIKGAGPFRYKGGPVETFTALTADYPEFLPVNILVFTVFPECGYDKLNPDVLLGNMLDMKSNLSLVIMSRSVNALR